MGKLWPTFWVFVFLLYFSRYVLSTDVECPAEPLSIRIGNVTLGSDDRPVRPSVYGIRMTVGHQNFAPFIKHNSAELQIKSSDKTCNTTGADGIPTDCSLNAGKSRDKYLALRELQLRGLFDGAISPTYEGPMPWTNRQYGLPFVGNDLVSIELSPGNMLDLESQSFNSRYNSWSGVDDPVDFSLYDVEEWTPAYIGLNNYSTLLNGLTTAGRIPSRTWGYFSGWKDWAQPDKVEDGSLILGGYDKSKISAPFTTFPMEVDADATNRCQFKLKCKGMHLTIAGEDGGRTVEISTYLSKTRSSNFEACIDPSYDSLQLHRTIRDRLKEQMAEEGKFTDYVKTIRRGTGIGFLKSDLDKMGEISLTMQFDGINVTIPHRHLFHPPTNLTADGYRLIPDQSAYEVMEITDSTSTELGAPDSEIDTGSVILGYPFLASMYLLVDHENSTFGLAPIVDEIPTNTEIIPLPGSGCRAPTAETQVSPKMSTAAITGLSVGNGAIVIALIWAFVFFRRRRLRKRTLPVPPDVERIEADGKAIPPPVFEVADHKADSPQPIYEMMGDLAERQELDGDVPHSPNSNSLSPVSRDGMVEDDERSTRTLVNRGDQSPTSDAASGRSQQLPSSTRVRDIPDLPPTNNTMPMI